jgi:DNA-binding transcriptional LysR family regulator
VGEAIFLVIRAMRVIGVILIFPPLFPEPIPVHLPAAPPVIAVKLPIRLPVPARPPRLLRHPRPPGLRYPFSPAPCPSSAPS